MESVYICGRLKIGAIAQLVEQQTENLCVPGSIPGGTTNTKAAPYIRSGFFFNYAAVF